MSNLKVGTAYEDFIERVYQAILEAERRQGNIARISIQRNKIILSKSGTPAEIDIYWEYEVAGITHSVAIECKSYNKKIDIPRVRDFARKIQQISGLKGLMVTKLGYSENAIKEASADNIDLLVIREQQPTDWEDRVKSISVNIHILNPCRTIQLNPKYNKEWALNNGYKKGDAISFNSTNDKIIIYDDDTGFRYSLLELEQNDFFEKKLPGKHEWKREFKNGWINFDQTKMKIDAIELEYQKPATTLHEFSIDFEQYVLAIMEYINGKGGKYVILTSGEKKNY